MSRHKIFKQDKNAGKQANKTGSAPQTPKAGQNGIN